MKFNKIFLLAGIVALGVFSSCSDDDDDYKKGPQVTGQGANFGEISQNETVVTKETSLSFDVFREDASSEADIPVTVIRNDQLDGKEVFNIPSAIHFDAGQEKTTFTVTYPNATIGDFYTFNVKIPEEYAHYYKVNQFSRTIQRDYNWVEVAGYMVDTFMGAKGEITLEHAVGFNKWRILQPFKNTWVDEEGNPDYSSDNVAEVIEVAINEDGSVDWHSFRYGCYDAANGYVDGYMHDGWYQINGYRPSELAASIASSDAESGVSSEDPTLLQLVPYFYIDGLGGFGLQSLGIYVDEEGIDWFTK